MSAPVEFNFGDDQTWVAGTEADPGRWVSEHTYSVAGDYTITARHPEAGQDQTSVSVEIPPSTDPAVISISPSDTIVMNENITVTGTGFADGDAVWTKITGGANPDDYDPPCSFVSDTEMTVSAFLPGTVTEVWVVRGADTESNHLTTSLEITAPPG